MTCLKPLLPRQPFRITTGLLAEDGIGDAAFLDLARGLAEETLQRRFVERRKSGLRSLFDGRMGPLPGVQEQGEKGRG